MAGRGAWVRGIGPLAGQSSSCGEPGRTRVPIAEAAQDALAHQGLFDDGQLSYLGATVGADQGVPILDVHIVGECATELIHVGQAVILLGGTIDYFVQNAFNFPTLAEAYKVAALDARIRLSG